MADVDYRTVAQTPLVDLNEIGNALRTRDYLQERPARQMAQAQALEAGKLQNRLLFMAEKEKLDAERAELARRAELIAMGLPAETATAAAATMTAPAPAAAPVNAFTGVPAAVPAGFLPGPVSPEAPAPWNAFLTPEGESPSGVPAAGAVVAPGPAAGGPIAVSAPAVSPPPPAPGQAGYSPEAWGRYTAQVQRADLERARRKEATADAKGIFETALKLATDAGSQEMVDFILTQAKKNPALAPVVGWLGDPSGPQEQQLKVTGKGKTETESMFTTKDQFTALAPMAANDIVRKAIEGAEPGRWVIKTEGSKTVDGKQVPKIVEFKPAAAEAAHYSEIKKLQMERDAKIETLIASGKYKTREEAMKDPDVAALNDAVTKKSEPKAEAAKDRYLDVKTRILMNDPKGFPVTQEDKNFVASYEKEKQLGPEAYGAARLEMLLQNPISVYDTNTGTVGFKTKRQINEGDAANEAEGLPPRYVGAELATKLKSRKAIFEEIKQSARTARASIGRLKENFSQTQLIKFADQLAVDDDGGMLRTFLSSNIAKTLSKDEIEYITSIRNLRESSFSLRTIGGMGQGSDMLRNAIAEMIPGRRTPNKTMAFSAMNKFDMQVQKLEEGVPGIGAEGFRRAVEKRESSKRSIKNMTNEEILAELKK